MNDVRVRFTVFFEEPFWIGIYECEYASQYEVNKVTFGAEPKDYEIYEFILIRWQEIKTTSIINNQHDKSTTSTKITAGTREDRT
ncbi:MAG: hypothetical protein K0S30_1369 [Clostridia bacterium]|nr:hypothetical protein [Clostridia bacterium]